MSEPARRPGLLAILLLASAGVAAAADEEGDPRLRPFDTPGLTVEVVAGIGGTCQPSLPRPVTITAANRTGSDILGTWEIEETEGRPAQRGRLGRRPPKAARLCKQVADLADRAKKRVRFCLDLGGGALSVRLVSRGEVLWQRAVPGLFSRSGLGASVRKLDPSHLRLLLVGPDLHTRLFSRPQRRVTGRTEHVPAPGTRQVAVAAAPGWQIPCAAMPLFAFHAIVFSPTANPSDLRTEQRRALADYVRWGGVVVAPAARRDFAELLIAALPKTLAAIVAAPKPGDRRSLVVAPICAGRLVLAGEEFFGMEKGSADMREKLLRMLENRREPSCPSFVTPDRYRGGRMTPNAIASLFLIGSVFVVYALATGPAVLLFLRRRSRKVIAWYVVGCMGLFSLASLLAGPAVGSKRGDLQWLTVTELTDQGGVQWSMITALSAGGRRHRLRLDGFEAAGWILPNTALAGYGWRGRREYAMSFSDRNMSFDVDGAHGERRDLSVPMTAWGTRLVLANAYWPKGRRIEASVKFTPKPLGPKERASRGPGGQFRRNATIQLGGYHIALRNPLPIPLHNVRVVVGAWLRPPDEPGRSRQQRAWRERLADRPCWQVLNMGTLMPLEGRRSSGVASEIRWDDWRWRLANLAPRPRDGNRSGAANAGIPAANSSGRTFGWVVAETSASPSLRIGPCSFDADDGVHMIVQEMRPDDLPPLSALQESLDQR